METELIKNLLSLLEGFQAAKGLKESTIGRLCAQDSAFFSRLRDGKTFTARKYDEVVSWFDDNWPEGAQWPDSIRRPSVPVEVDA